MVCDEMFAEVKTTVAASVPVVVIVVALEIALIDSIQMIQIKIDSIYIQSFALQSYYSQL